MRRAVFDVNILVSAVLFPGIFRTLVESLDKNKFTLVLSPSLLEDFLRVIEKPKLKRLIIPEFAEDFISLLHQKSLIVEPQIKVRACRDPSDDAVLEAALAAKADMVVTGDKDLLTMRSFKKVMILSPSAFSRKLKIG